MLINRKKQLLILFGLYAIGFGQTIHGRVVDSITQVPLGNCNISIQGTTRGTASNSEGFYSLRLPSGTYVLKFEYLGYNSFIKTIQLDKEPVNLTVSLVPSMIQLEPITVFSDEKSAVELLILKASRIKGKSQFIKNYVCHSYTKTSYRSALDPNSFGGILETYSELYYNSPDTWHEELLSQRQTSNFPQSVNFVSGNTFLDVNADRIEIGGNTLIGPTAPDAIEHYTFSIQDTLFQDNNRIFKIHFTPKNNNQPAMAGELYLADKYFLINHIDADLNSFCNYDLFENIHILQKYKALNDSIYVPNYSLRECDFALEFPGAPKIRTVKENYRENYQVNIPQNQISPIENTVVISQNIPFKSIPMLIPPLTIEEEMAYLQIDSLVTHNYRMKILTRIFKFVDLYSKFNSKPVGDISDFIRFNRVEGLFAGLAYNSKNRWESSMLKVGAGYGISDERFKYFVINSMAYQISIFRIQAALHSYDRIATIESQDDIPLLANSMNSLLRNFDYYDYYFVKGNRLNFQLNWSDFTLKSTAIFERHSIALQTVNHGLFIHPEFVDNPEIIPGKMRGGYLRIGFSNIRYLESDLSTRIIPNQNFTRAFASIESGIREWGSDFDYNQYQTLIQIRRNLPFNLSTDILMEIASSTGELPSQKFMEVPGGHPGYNLSKGFSTIKQNELRGPQKLILYTEWTVKDIVSRFGLMDKPWDVSLILNTGWAGNKSLRSLKMNDFYSETGIGVNNFFKIMKIELLFRLNNPNYQSIPYSINFKIEDFDIF